MKTDGDYIFTVSQKILTIIEAYPGQDAQVVSTIKFDFTVSSIFI